ncbi:MAG: ferric reductase-like transmembrane domain-containing protein [Pseudomonadota bacterium]
MVQWTAFKKRFDLWMLAGIVVYLAGFIIISFVAQPAGEMFTPIQVLIRVTGTLAFLLLTFILCIGPLARLSDQFKPFLYNRRHLGVTTFFFALIHAGLVLLWYHGFSDVNVIVSLFVSNPRYDSVSGFPFESLGAVALIILFVMAATSHDFWICLPPAKWPIF